MAYLFKFLDDYIRFIESGRAISLIANLCKHYSCLEPH